MLVLLWGSGSIGGVQRTILQQTCGCLSLAGFAVGQWEYWRCAAHHAAADIWLFVPCWFCCGVVRALVYSITVQQSLSCRFYCGTMETLLVDTITEHQARVAVAQLWHRSCRFCCGVVRALLLYDVAKHLCASVGTIHSALACLAGITVGRWERCWCTTSPST